MYELRALRERVLDVLLDFLDRAVVDQRPVRAKWRSLVRKVCVVRQEGAYVSLSRPLPTLNAATFSARRDAKSAYTDDCTYIRFAHTHVWPVPRNLHAIAPERR